MSDNTYNEPRENTDSPLLTLRITPELSDRIASATTATKLGRSAMLRLAIDRGLDRLLEQLEVTTETTNTGADQFAKS